MERTSFFQCMLYFENANAELSKSQKMLTILFFHTEQPEIILAGEEETKTVPFWVE